jgi:FxsC-like protein
VPRDHLGAEANPFFFLGYAHTPERPWVERLFKDLSAEVLERTTLSLSTAAGFMDLSAIPLGSDWREEVGKALATCRVFVPLYSPRYFTRVECGIEWHAFGQRVLDHRARYPGSPAPVVPALWTPVEPDDLPDAARRIQMNHADLGGEYAQEGFYTLIKNTLYRQEYVTAVQRLARHIIRAGERARLAPCRVSDLGPPRDAFGMSGPADRRLTVVVAAPTVDRLPPGRSKAFYGSSSNDWNPFHPASRQTIAEFAAGVARLNAYEPTILSFDEGFGLLSSCDASNGLGLLLVDAWAGADDETARRLSRLDALELGWVATVVPWNPEDEQTLRHADELRDGLRSLLPNRLGDARPFSQLNPARISSLEQFRMRLPDVLDGALFRYLNHVEAHPPAGRIPPRPRLSSTDDDAI